MMQRLETDFWPGKGWRLALRGGRGGGGAGGLWRDMPPPRKRSKTAGVAVERAKAGGKEAKQTPASGPRKIGAHGLPVQLTPGFEDDASDKSEGECDTTNPRVLARRRRSRERRKRLSQHKHEQKQEQEALRRQQQLEEAIQKLEAGSTVLAHFKSKTGQSKKPAIMSVAHLDLAQSQVSVKTSSGRVQAVPLSWILAVKNNTGGGEAVPQMSRGEGQGDSRPDQVENEIVGGGTVGKNVTMGKKWLDDKKFKEILHRRRARARLRRRQVSHM
jgi:hypothetical protein